MDVAFNNAGSTSPRGSIVETSAADWAEEIASNLTSVFLCLKHEMAVMDAGAIVNNASIAAVRGTPGLRVNALITGNVDTPLYRRLSGVGTSDELPPAPNPSGRVATPEEIASFVAYLLSDDAAFITGAALAADGGFTAS